jgi:hypothetical protein
VSGSLALAVLVKTEGKVDLAMIGGRPFVDLEGLSELLREKGYDRVADGLAEAARARDTEITN